jgi:DNA-binding CsgD family transcriptional regulator
VRNWLEQLVSIADPEKLQDLDKHATSPFQHFYFCKDLNGHYLGCNDAMAQALGFNKGKDILGYRDFDLCWANAAPHFRMNDMKVITNEKPMMIIEAGQLIDGHESSAWSYKLPLRSRSQKTIGIICMSIPIDQQTIIAHSLPQHKMSLDTFITSPPLPKRQKECLYYLVKGMTIKEIAHKLTLSTRTVEHYLETIKAKFNCHTRSQLIAKIVET